MSNIPKMRNLIIDVMSRDIENNRQMYRATATVDNTHPLSKAWTLEQKWVANFWVSDYHDAVEGAPLHARIAWEHYWEIARGHMTKESPPEAAWGVTGGL